MMSGICHDNRPLTNSEKENLLLMGYSFILVARDFLYASIAQS